MTATWNNIHRHMDFPRAFIFLTTSHSLNQTVFQHIQLCGYSQSGSPLCELLRNVNTLTTVTGTIIYQALCYTGAKHCVCVILPATDKPLRCESRHCGGQQRESE